MKFSRQCSKILHIHFFWTVHHEPMISQRVDLQLPRHDDNDQCSLMSTLRLIYRAAELSIHQAYNYAIPAIPLRANNTIYNIS